MTHPLRQLFEESDRIDDRYLSAEEIEQRNAELLKARTEAWWEITDQDLLDEVGEEFMSKSIGYYGGDYENPAIAKFAEQFEQSNGECGLDDNDKSALVAVLAQHAWGLRSGLEEDFWTNVNHAIGDGVETSLETEESDAPLAIALESLSFLSDSLQCYSLIAWLIE